MKLGVSFCSSAVHIPTEYCFLTQEIGGLGP